MTEGNMDKAFEILKHINNLYVGDTSDEQMREFMAKNLEKFNAWREAFEPFDLDDVLMMVDKFWTEKSNKTAPRVAQLLAMLNNDKEVKKHFKVEEKPEEKATWETFWNSDPAMGYYLKDLEEKKDVHALIFYRWALRDIMVEMVETLPNSSKMSQSEKIKIIRRNGWDNDITERAESYAKEAGKSSGSVDSFVAGLAKRWKDAG